MTGSRVIRVAVTKLGDIQIFLLDVAVGGSSYVVALAIAQGADDSSWDSEHQLPGWHSFARRDDSPGTHLSTRFDHGAVENARADADQGSIVDRAAMNHTAVPDHHATADLEWMCLVTDMQDGPVLNVGSASDLDPVHITASGGLEPEGAVIPDLNVADDPGTRSQKDTFAESRLDAIET